MRARVTVRVSEGKSDDGGEGEDRARVTVSEGEGEVRARVMVRVSEGEVTVSVTMRVRVTPGRG